MQRLELPSFTHGNTKLPDNIMIFSLPSGFTCPGACKCLTMANRDTGKLAHGPQQEFRCYSALAEARFSSTRSSRWRNLDLVTGKSADQLAELLTLSVRAQAQRKTTHVRWFGAGDAFSAALRDGIIAAAEHTSWLVHYLYTKNLPLWLGVDLPSNMRLTASWGGKFDHLIEEGHFPRSARVVTTEEEAAALGLPIDFTDAYAYDPTPQHFAHLVHGTQTGELQRQINARAAAGGFRGYGSRRRSASAAQPLAA